MLWNIPHFTKPIKSKEAREEAKEKVKQDHRFYTRCLRVLSRKKGKKKLIEDIQYRRECCEKDYDYYDY